MSRPTLIKLPVDIPFSTIYSNKNGCRLKLPGLGFPDGLYRGPSDDIILTFVRFGHLIDYARQHSRAKFVDSSGA